MRNQIIRYSVSGKNLKNRTIRYTAYGKISKTELSGIRYTAKIQKTELSGIRYPAENLDPVRSLLDRVNFNKCKHWIYGRDFSNIFLKNNFIYNEIEHLKM